MNANINYAEVTEDTLVLIAVAAVDHTLRIRKIVSRIQETGHSFMFKKISKCSRGHNPSS